MELLRWAVHALTLPWRIGRDLLASDHELDELIAHHRRIFLEQHEGE